MSRRVVSGNSQLLRTQSVRNLLGYAFLRFDDLRIGLRAEGSATTTITIFLRHLFPVLRLAVKGLKVNASVNLPRLNGRNGIT